jgi:hypothetical protein
MPYHCNIPTINRLLRATKNLFNYSVFFVVLSLSISSSLILNSQVGAESDGANYNSGGTVSQGPPPPVKRIDVNIFLNITTPKDSTDTYGPIKLYKYLKTDTTNDISNAIELTTDSKKSADGHVQLVVSNILDINYKPLPSDYKICMLDGISCKGIEKQKDDFTGTTYFAEIDISEKDSEKYITGTTDTVPTTNCAIKGIGWMVCPVMSLVGSLTDGAYWAVSSMLETPPINTDITDPQNGMYSSWSIMRSIANVAFVIAFLIIIFSQLTSVGISNYGIKKMLPRLIVAAILVNISYYICAVAVDLSNIIGGSMKAILDSISNSIPMQPDNSWANASWEARTGAVLTGGLASVGLAAVAIEGTAAAVAASGAVVGVAGIIWYAFLAFFVPGLLIALLAILVIFLVLTLRAALIIILIVMSPLAFVAFLLPNTSGWFSKWRELFTTLLIMYPIIAVVFGGSALASKIIMASSSDWSTQLMGSLITIIPLAITPIVMKTAGGLLNRFGVLIDNPGKGIFDRARNGAKAMAEKQEAKIRTPLFKGTTKLGKYGLMGGYMRKRAQSDRSAEDAKEDFSMAKAEFLANNTPSGASNRAMARAASVLSGIEDKNVSDRATLLKQDLKPGDLDKAKEYLDDFIKKNDSVGAMAAISILQNTGRGRDLIQGSIGKMIYDEGKSDGNGNMIKTNESTVNAMRSAILSSGLRGKNALLDSFGVNGFDSVDSVVENEKRNIVDGKETKTYSYSIKTKENVFNGLTDAELMGQSGSLVKSKAEEFIKALTPEKAQRIIKNPNLTNNADTRVMEVLDNYIKNTAPKQTSPKYTEDGRSEILESGIIIPRNNKK